MRSINIKDVFMYISTSFIAGMWLPGIMKNNQRRKELKAIGCNVEEAEIAVLMEKADPTFLAISKAVEPYVYVTVLRTISLLVSVYDAFKVEGTNVVFPFTIEEFNILLQHPVIMGDHQKKTDLCSALQHIYNENQSNPMVPPVQVQQNVPVEDLPFDINKDSLPFLIHTTICDAYDASVPGNNSLKAALAPIMAKYDFIEEEGDDENPLMVLDMTWADLNSFVAIFHGFGLAHHITIDLAGIKDPSTTKIRGE